MKNLWNKINFHWFEAKLSLWFLIFLALLVATCSAVPASSQQKDRSTYVPEFPVPLNTMIILRSSLPYCSDELTMMNIIYDVIDYNKFPTSVPDNCGLVPLLDEKHNRHVFFVVFIVGDNKDTQYYSLQIMESISQIHN